METAPDAIITVDDRGHITALNKTFEVATGIPRGRAMGAGVLDVIDPRDRDLVASMFRATLQGTVQRGEVRFLHREGGTGWASIVASPLYSGGVANGALAIVRNITQEKRVVEQMMRHERMAAVGHLVSGLSHELNNPLASVMALGELLVESPALPPEEHESAELILDEARRAAKIIGNLLAFARQQPSQKSPLDINVLVAQAVDMRRYALQLDNMMVDVRLTPHLPPVLADASQLQQVLLNLLANAEQALTDWPGERHLSVLTTRTGDHVAVTVTDSGPGIQPENRARIFDPFFTTRGVGKGTGLGLSVAEGIVRDHGGRIYVESSLGAGATFVVELPLARPAGDPVTTSKEWPVPVKPLRLLVVDDEAGIREALTRLLSRMGHAVDAAADGFEARERLASRTYDRILLDVRMPGLSGDTLYRELADRSQDLASRVIFLTGDSENATLQSFVASTGCPCITKPFTLDDVRRSIADVVQS
ncbi:MAG: ATP-binding protein [Gemmatimonadaceae bacterium]